MIFVEEVRDDFGGGNVVGDHEFEDFFGRLSKRRGTLELVVYSLVGKRMEELIDGNKFIRFRVIRKVIIDKRKEIVNCYMGLHLT
jgi:hypothetical protein